jgi:hydrogenase maturation protease
VTARWTVLACGDPARGDDALGLVAVELLGREDRHDARVRCVGQLLPDDLVAALAAGPCVVVDAVRGIGAGDLVEMPLRDLVSGDGPIPASSHALPLPMVVGLAEALGADIDNATFIGIGGGSFALGEGVGFAAWRGARACAAAIERHLHAADETFDADRIDVPLEVPSCA